MNDEQEEKVNEQMEEDKKERELWGRRENN